MRYPGSKHGGFVGGADGDGIYAGEILKYTEGTTTVIEALYYFDGAKFPFTALVHVEQTGMNEVISGVVTEGWMKGNQVEGECTQITSKQSSDGAAYRACSTSCERRRQETLDARNAGLKRFQEGT